MYTRSRCSETSSCVTRPRHYVIADDKPRILAAVKQVSGDRLTPVFPHQRHYALDHGNIAAYPPPANLTIEHIGELATVNLSAMLGATDAHIAVKEKG